MKRSQYLIALFLLIPSLNDAETTEATTIRTIAESIKQNQRQFFTGHLSEKISFPFQGDGSLGEFTREVAIKNINNQNSYMYAILFDTKLARVKTSVKDFQSCFEVCQKGSISWTSKSIHCEYANYTWDIVFRKSDKNELLIRFFDINYR